MRDWAAHEYRELQGKDDYEEERRDDAQPPQWDKNHPATQEQPGEKHAAHGEEGCADDRVPAWHLEQERAERIDCRGIRLNYLAADIQVELPYLPSGR